jgi:hypothetical protein
MTGKRHIPSRLNLRARPQSVHTGWRRRLERRNMWQRGWLWVMTGAFVFGPAIGAPDLAAIERRWLEAAVPVLSYARSIQLPLDIIVQPQDTPGETPMGMAFVDGRCKLVLSMRGNPEAQATLDSIPKELVGPVVEAIAAHELGHCWRHLRHSWGTLPAGLKAPSLAGMLAPAHAELLTDMWRTRREEAFADLVGLAWTLRHHRSRYAEVHAWHVKLRAEQAVDTGPHDTRVWVRLAADPKRFVQADSIFEQVEPLWAAGMMTPD